MNGIVILGGNRSGRNSMRESFIDSTVEFVNKQIEDHCEKECDPEVCMGDDCHYKKGMLHILNKINEQR